MKRLLVFIMMTFLWDMYADAVSVPPPPASQPGLKKQIVLPATTAKLDGTSIRLQNNENIGFWFKGESISWDFEIKEALENPFILDYSCMKNQTVEIYLDDKLLFKRELKATDAWTAYEFGIFDNVSLAPGRHRLRILVPEGDDCLINVRSASFREKPQTLIELPAAAAKIDGQNLRLESVGQKKNIGCWKRGESISWDFSVKNAEVLALYLDYACLKKQTPEIYLDDKLLFKKELAATGNWRMYQPEIYDDVTLSPGKHTLRIAIPEGEGFLFNIEGAVFKEKELKFLAADATARGCRLESTKNLGNWGKNGRAEWKFTLEKPETRFLILNYSSQAASKAHITIPGVLDKTIDLQTTNAWGSYRSVTIGMVTIPAGTHKLIVENHDVNPFINLMYMLLSSTPVRSNGTSYPEIYAPKTTWAESMLAMREAYAVPDVYYANFYNGQTLEFRLNENDIRGLWRDFPKEIDWFLQDNQVHDGWCDAGFDARKDFLHYLDLKRDNTLEKQLIQQALDDLGDQAGDCRKKLAALVEKNLPPDDPAWLGLYVECCGKRRQLRLAPLLATTDKIIYATHMNMGTIYLATETQGCPDGSELRIIDLSPEKDGRPLIDEQLFDSKNGIVRDPELSFDAKKLLFAWRTTNAHANTTGAMAPEKGNYKIYEMDLRKRNIRKLTDDKTYGADFEPCYLPNGNIMFSSARCVQEVTCGWGDCSNLYVMDKDGDYARRLGFDQTQTAFPHLLDDGRIVFTRRDYNDRGQTYAHSLFVMNPDGTFQTEYYGNNTCEPTSLQHTRPIPGTGKTMSIAGGYHTTQGGKLVIVDPKKGRQEYEGLTFVNWDHEKKITGGDSYGREGEQYAYPYPLDENLFLVSYEPFGGYLFNKSGALGSGEQGRMLYKLYAMTRDGSRELLASHPTLSCTQAIPVAPRRPTDVRASMVDYTKDTGLMYVEDVYFGPSAEGIKQGTIKKIRISMLYYKPATIGGACWGPPQDQIGPGKKYSSFGQHSILPVGVGTASFDAKRILGEVDVEADGSAMFEVPARIPIYLQLVDENGHVAQYMRSWATLMPNERFSCVGCHEDKMSTPMSRKKTIAMSKTQQKMKPFYDISDKPFSYAKLVQPIFNKHCVSCHAPGKKGKKVDLTDTIVIDEPGHTGTSSTQRRFYQSYLTLLKVRPGKDGIATRLTPGEPNEWVNYHTRLLTVERTPPYYAGSGTSGLLKMLEKGHNQVVLTQEELDKISAWIDLNVPFIGEYDEMNNWTAREKDFYNEKMKMRGKMETIEEKNIKAFIKARQPN